MNTTINIDYFLKLINLLVFAMGSNGFPVKKHFKI